MPEEETQFEKFWTASNLDEYNSREFAQQLNAYEEDDKELFLEYPENPVPLLRAPTRVNKVAKKRRSDRAFSGKSMSRRELARMLSSFYAWNGLEHRGYPSAGATYVTEIFGVTFDVKGLPGKIIYYDQENHGMVVVDDNAPSWDTTRPSLNIETAGVPNLLLIFAIFPERAVMKYGDRGGRFALIETGTAVQQLALQIADSSRLRGVAVGGMYDEAWKQILQLKNTDAKIALGYLVGK